MNCPVPANRFLAEFEYVSELVLLIKIVKLLVRFFYGFNVKLIR